MDRASGANFEFQGRIFLRGSVRALTGLHIGGSAGALAIGTVDQPVIRNPLNDQPYIPGSSIRGKMRSLAEKFRGLRFEHPVGQVKIHVCQNQADYLTCDVCQVFGAPSNMHGQRDYGGPTRLLVRDVGLGEQSARQLEDLQTDLPYTEIKWEVAIDRVTAAATPRQQERVPAGAIFEPLDLVYSVYQAADLDRFPLVVHGLLWIEDDYLGGQGSRGSGKVQFENLQIAVRGRQDYATETRWEPTGDATRPSEILERSGDLREWLRAQLTGPA